MDCAPPYILRRRDGPAYAAVLKYRSALEFLQSEEGAIFFCHGGPRFLPEVKHSDKMPRSSRVIKRLKVPDYETRNTSELS